MLTGSMHPRHRRARHGAASTSWRRARSNLRWMARKAIERKRKSKPARGCARTLAAACGRRAACSPSKLRAETAKKVREEHYPAPFRLIDLFETHAGNLDGMKVAETRAFAPLMVERHLAATCAACSSCPR